jgi:hypothetical protein
VCHQNKFFVFVLFLRLLLLLIDIFKCYLDLLLKTDKMHRDNLRLLKVSDTNIGDSASPAINPEICDGISLICQRIVRRMGFARDPDSRALRRRLLIRSALLLSRPQLPPPHSDDPHGQSSNDISRIVRSVMFILFLYIAFSPVALTVFRFFDAGRLCVLSKLHAHGFAFTTFR